MPQISLLGLEGFVHQKVRIVEKKRFGSRFTYKTGGTVGQEVAEILVRPVFRCRIGFEAKVLAVTFNGHVESAPSRVLIL